MKRINQPKLVHNVIAEYLTKKGLHHTLETFQTETSYEEEIIGGQEIAILQAFDEGRRIDFFDFWSSLPLINESEQLVQKLEFYIMVYFATFPLHSLQEPVDEALLSEEMNAFRSYIETQGAKLSKTPEFLSYYALPYIKNIQDHPSFSSILTPEWNKSLRGELVKFLKRLTAAVQPLEDTLIERLISEKSNVQDSGDSSEALRFQIGQLERQYMEAKIMKESATQKLIESQSKWTSFAKDILVITNKKFMF